MIGRLIGLVFRNPMGVLAATAVAVAWGAISVNALLLQVGPHPAPFLGRDALAGMPTVQPAPKPARRVSEGAPAEIVDAEQRRIAEREAVMTRDLQIELARRNFYNGPVDGRFGPQTEAAIRAYEVAAGLVETGQPNDVLLAHVRLSTLSAPPVPAPSPLRSATAQTDATGSIQPAGDPLAALLAAPKPVPVQTVAIQPAPSATVAQQPVPTQPVPQATASDTDMPPDPTIEAVQTILADLGYAPGSIDGQIGPSTKRAIEDFEVDRGLPMTGAVSQRLLEELSAVSGVPFG